nr:PRA1 family protein F3-like [Ipomoea batatas]
MTTTYGTIPTSDNGLEARLGFLAMRRPWKEMVISFSTPGTLAMALSRLKGNVAYFYTNYAILVLVVVFLSLLWRPASLIVFIIMMAAWLYLYFLRDVPLVIKGYAVDERVVLVVLSIFTTLLLLTTAAANMMTALAVGTAAVAAHGVFSGADNSAPIDQEDGRGKGEAFLQRFASEGQWLEEERGFVVEKIEGSEMAGEELGQGCEGDVTGFGDDVIFGLGGDEDLEGGRVAELLEELAAVAAGGGGDGEGDEAGPAVGEEIGDEELLGVDGVGEREAGELHVDSDEDAAVGGEANGGDAEVGDGRTGECLSWLHESRKEMGHAGKAH